MVGDPEVSKTLLSICYHVTTRIVTHPKREGLARVEFDIAPEDIPELIESVGAIPTAELVRVDLSRELPYELASADDIGTRYRTEHLARMTISDVETYLVTRKSFVTFFKDTDVSPKRATTGWEILADHATLHDPVRSVSCTCNMQPFFFVFPPLAKAARPRSTLIGLAPDGLASVRDILTELPTVRGMRRAVSGTSSEPRKINTQVAETITRLIDGITLLNGPE